MTEQFEIEGTASPDRDDELHALGMELYDLQTRRMELTRQEKAKREIVGGEPKKRKLTEYDVDGVHLWIEETEKIKVKLGGDADEEE